jgi:hypothetical protein
VRLDGEHAAQPVSLSVGEQVDAGAQHAPDAVERVTGTAPVSR